MDVKLIHPFEVVNVIVDCGGSRVDGPLVNIDVVNGEIDAKKSAIKITGVVHLHPFQANADATTQEQAFKELVNLVVAKLIELTPSHVWAHAWYGTTQEDLITNATQIVAQLKDSPTLASIVKTLSGGDFV